MALEWDTIRLKILAIEWEGCDTRHTPGARAKLVVGQECQAETEVRAAGTPGRPVGYLATTLLGPSVHPLHSKQGSSPQLVKSEGGQAKDDLLEEASRKVPEVGESAGGCLECGGKLTTLRWKEKKTVIMKNGTSRKVSKVMSCTRCLECTTRKEPEVRKEPRDLNPSQKGEGGLKQIKIEGFLQPNSRTSSLGGISRAAVQRFSEEPPLSRLAENEISFSTKT